MATGSWSCVDVQSSLRSAICKGFGIIVVEMYSAYAVSEKPAGWDSSTEKPINFQEQSYQRQGIHNCCILFGQTSLWGFPFGHAVIAQDVITISGNTRQLDHDVAHTDEEMIWSSFLTGVGSRFIMLKLLPQTMAKKTSFSTPTFRASQL